MAAFVQPDHEECIRAFREHVDRILTDSASEKAFIPIDHLEDYLNRRQTGELLAAVTKDVWNVKHVHENYLRVFAILLYIGKAEYINSFLPYADLDDDHLLPYPSQHPPPPHWPRVASSNDFFPLFYEAQWQFCALKFTEKLQKRVLDNDLVLPIIEKEELRSASSGESATIYKIKLHNTYNDLVEKTEDGLPITNTFVLKTYYTSEAEKYYRNEVDAFTQLMNPAKLAKDNMVAFYGAYRHCGTYNVILEYADSGNLEEYFERTMPPTKEKDILSFWNNLFNIVQPLQRIHEIKSDGHGPLVLQGVHQDVKPANILVCSRPGLSDYQCNFKLADLGLSHFTQKVGKEKDITSRDLCGTPMYSAPECCRLGRFMERTALEITPKIDIWSLGCVFSEAAVWVVLGSHGLRRYHDFRTAETDGVPDFKQGGYSGCFHNGSRILEAVGKMHRDILEERRTFTDHITEYVIELIDGMLDEDTEARFSATQVYKRSQRILAKAKEKKYPEVFGTVTNPVVPPRTPPEVPPEHAGLGIRHSASSRSSQGVLSNHGRTGSELSNAEMSPLSHHSWSKHPNRAQSSRRAVSWGQESEPNASSPPSTARGSRLVSPVNERSKATLLPQTNVAQTDQEWDDEYGPGPVSPFRGASRAHTGNGKARAEGEGEHDYRRSLQSPTHGASEATTGNGIAPAEDLVREERPKLSVQELHNWIKKTKSMQTPSLTGGEYLKRLKNRDHIFLIDDSASMRPYWPKLKWVFQALAYIVKRADPNGLDLYFTSSFDKFHRKHTSYLVDLVEKRKAKLAGRCNIKASLGKILQDYRVNLQALDANRAKSRFGISKVVFPVSIYIFTDGVWQDRPEPICGVNEPIENLVKELTDRRLLDGQAGIQFIRFGNDKVGSERLRMVDNHRRLGLSMDIVDTTSCDGNVLKMLLGAFDRDWDDDEDDDEDTATHSNGISTG